MFKRAKYILVVIHIFMESFEVALHLVTVISSLALVERSSGLADVKILNASV